MSPLHYTVLSASLALHLIALAFLIRHLRAERRRRLPGLIGSHPRLTETLYQRLSHRQPQTDWLNPNVMRRKVRAWLNRNR
ncbi:hypothetical protein [Prosthecobacter vanneervenii]|uniref:Uncharacterized protein n=1 Tax=Prosthecobacter vanneervenii TaxID=48466 RepID=A0A7W7YBP4_9BACT|nr:hypothetical protein [Prosthecobacter vanneervenii]MBB5033145.1 hypothetical protein [Prosthecobacter vanneervenii]